MSSDNIVQIRGLHKRFGSSVALDGLDLSVTAGEVHGFLGPNGSGKSTTLRIMLGLLRATSGEVRVLGGDPWRDAVSLHRRIAYVPGEVSLWPNLSGGETIDILGKLRGGLDETLRDELLERFHLDPARRIDTYSKGNRQKVALVAALASRVELYLFDEPTSGLDPLMEEEFRSCVGELKRDGATILLSSHILSEVDALADSVTIIREGRTVEAGSLKDMRHLARTAVSVETAASPDPLKELAGLTELRIDGNTATFQVESGHLNDVVAALSTIGVTALTSAPPTLEDLFLRHYSKRAD